MDRNEETQPSRLATTSGERSPGSPLSCGSVRSRLDSGAHPVRKNPRQARRVPARKGVEMGQPVVHFEITGKDGEKLQGFYSDLFGWDIDANNEFKYGTVSREGNTNADGVGI